MIENEQELVDGCRRRERQAQRRLYDALGGRMFALCLRYVHDRADAEDVMQDAFVKVYENIDSYRGESPLLYWVRSIVVNTALKHLRRKKHTLELDEVNGSELPTIGPEVTLAGFQMEQLLGFIHALPPGCRTIFNLFAIEGYQHKEIAQLLNISEGTSKSQYARAKSLLQQKLTKEYRFDNESVRKTQF